MARGFRSALLPLLERRKRIEDERRRDLALCRRALDESDRSLEGLNAERVRCSHAADLRLRDAYLCRLDAEEASLRGRRRELHAAWEGARDALVAANREHRVVEKLHERRLRAFQIEAARREEAELDDADARRRERALRERVAYAAAEGAAR
ncbi:MAG TPA: flagellar export protein FliJ [Candidatus Binatia bacterium]|nr:flagellar export protein FliJ [Candidatus Binatia bacterium]